MRKKWTTGIISVIIFTAFFSCEVEDVTYKTENVLFENNIQISVPEYTFLVENQAYAYYFGGDSSYINNITDTVASKPEFRWNETSASFLMAAVFNNPIQTDNTGIINKDDIVWYWNTGMEIENNSQVKFEEGILSGYDETLTNGDYYFAIWGWDKSATEIRYSSFPMHFYVMN